MFFARTGGISPKRHTWNARAQDVYLARELPAAGTSRQTAAKKQRRLPFGEQPPFVTTVEIATREF